MRQVIKIHADAPDKPSVGLPCNGCGVCCALEPCPIGILVSRRRRGACAALEWDEAERRYICGMVAHPAAHLKTVPAWLVPLAAKIALRMIAAGKGCDSDLSVSRPAAPGPAGGPDEGQLDP